MKIDEILREGIEKEASDVHIVCILPPLLRINGILQKIEKFGDINPERSEELLLEVLNDDQKQRLSKDLSLDFSYTIPGEGRFRCNYFFQRGTLAGAFRLISKKIPTIEELGLPLQIKEFSTYPRGLVLVTGPTGSGKSTTLAAIVELINQNRRENIITIEDPIEYLFTHKQSIVSQREILADTTSFSLALKNVLREDPDVIMVGEMRDLETVSSALTAAETGHLVFSTLHTQDAPQTIDRIIDIFPSYQQRQIRTQLAATLKAVLVQQLLPNVTEDGRVPAIELMFVNPAISNMIRENKAHQVYTAMQAGGKRGMMTMDRSLADLYRQGSISKDICIEKCHSREELQRMIA